MMNLPSSFIRKRCYYEHLAEQEAWAFNSMNVDENITVCAMRLAMNQKLVREAIRNFLPSYPAVIRQYFEGMFLDYDE